ncbi:MAG: hypothetical protein ABSE93_22835 [Terriglobia bacterium]|jgi:hypothetical protein
MAIIVVPRRMLAVLAQDNIGQIAQAIQANYPNDYYPLVSGQWLVVTTEGPKEFCDKLGITNGTTGSAVVVAFTNYFGRANPNIWEWITAKMGATLG